MKCFFHIARVVLEAKSPLLIASGENDPNLDVLLARDANGLPMVPATGIAGALRRLAGDRRFGEAGKIKDTRASDIVFSDGLIHLSDDKPRDGILFAIPTDDFWQFLQKPNPVQRDHVKLDGFGVAEKTAKFQRGAAPTGSRFSFDVSLMSTAKDDPDFVGILAMLRHPLFGLGGARRSGYGAMAIIRCNGGCFDLSDKAGWDRYTAFRQLEFGVVDELPDMEISLSGAAETISLALISEGFVMVGAEQAAIGDVVNAPDQTPYRESRIKWENGTGSIEKDVVVIPGSAIKGPLRHRTEFHFNRLHPTENTDAAIKALFGDARNEEKNSGGAGKVRIADATPPDDYCPKDNACILPHVSIDRFSGGAYRSALFDSQALWQMPIVVSIALEGGIDEAARKALDLAIKDLKSGHLQIGADGGDGLGVFLDVTPEVQNEPA